jgi:hypothetical protein
LNPGYNVWKEDWRMDPRGTPTYFVWERVDSVNGETWYRILDTCLTAEDAAALVRAYALKGPVPARGIAPSDVLADWERRAILIP